MISPSESIEAFNSDQTTIIKPSSVDNVRSFLAVFWYNVIWRETSGSRFKLLQSEFLKTRPQFASIFFYQERRNTQIRQTPQNQIRKRETFENEDNKSRPRSGDSRTEEDLKWEGNKQNENLEQRAPIWWRWNQVIGLRYRTRERFEKSNYVEVVIVSTEKIMSLSISKWTQRESFNLSSSSRRFQTSLYKVNCFFFF